MFSVLRLPYADLFGGVSAMSREHFQLVNGFSNVFWGWGGEDDDMANRIKAHGLHISRYPANVARYKMLTHKKEKANPKRWVKEVVVFLFRITFWNFSSDYSRFNT